jgi:hypothetical protein
MLVSLSVFAALCTASPAGSSPSAGQSDPVASGTASEGGFSVDWSQKGVNLTVAHKSRRQTNEPLLYRPDYLPHAKAFVLVTDASDGKFHVTVVDRTFRVLSQLEISGATSGMPAVVPCADNLIFADPGIFARAPIAGESNPSWLELRQQLNILCYSASNGSLRWQKPELAVGQPLAAGGAYLWTVRLTNPNTAYAGAKPMYEIEQLGGYSGKIVRSWAYPAEGIDLTAYRWRAELKGATCFLHRLEPWPD